MDTQDDAQLEYCLGAGRGAPHVIKQTIDRLPATFVLVRFDPLRATVIARDLV